MFISNKFNGSTFNLPDLLKMLTLFQFKGHMSLGAVG